MKKRIIALFVAVLLIFTFTACSNDSEAPDDTGADKAGNDENSKEPTDSGEDGEDVEISVTWWGSDTRHTITLDMIDAFEEKYPHIKVNPEYGSPDGYWDKLATRVAGGTAPDVIQFGGNYPDYVDKGALLPLNDFVGKEIDLEQFDQDVVDAGTIDGNLYGICLGTNMLTLVYNKDLIERVGGELPPETWTWEEMEKWAEGLAEKMDSGYFPMSDNSKSQTNYLGYFLRQRGKSIYRDGEVAFEEQDIVDWINLWEGFREKGLVPDAETASAYPETGPDTSLFVEGKTALILIYSNQLRAYQDAMEDELSLTLLPKGEETAAWIMPSQYMTIYSKTEHPNEAATFINFMVNDPEATSILGNERGVSSSAEVRELLAESSSPVDKKVYEYFNVATKDVKPMDPNLPNDQEFNDTFKLILEKVAFGQIDAEEGGKQVYELANDLVEKAGRD